MIRIYYLFVCVFFNVYDSCPFSRTGLYLFSCTGPYLIFRTGLLAACDWQHNLACD